MCFSHGRFIADYDTINDELRVDVGRVTEYGQVSQSCHVTHVSQSRQSAR
jgi:hypothetical protein